MTKEALKLGLVALETLMIERGSIYDQAITAIKEALANEALEKMAENARELGLDYEPAQPFITHNVEQPYDWSEWVCPDPKNYLMKCCDCGLVHEAQFGVVRYRSETERDDCDMVNDPNLQAVFRMRRSEEWMPEDTAHRSGGLPMAQQEQEPVAWEQFYPEMGSPKLAYLSPTESSGNACYIPPQRTWVGLTDEDFLEACQIAERGNYLVAFQRIQNKLKEKNETN